MTKTFSTWLIRAVTAASIASAPHTVLANQQPHASSPRVRSSHSHIAALIAMGTEHSHTFRGIVDTIAASDGIVYIEEGRCSGGVRACVKDVVKSGSNRFLWIRIDLRKDDVAAIATIAHELRHAIEILSAPAVTTSAAMSAFYRREGNPGFAGAFETAAAVAAGDAVHAELRRADIR